MPANVEFFRTRSGMAASCTRSGIHSLCGGYIS